MDISCSMAAKILVQCSKTRRFKSDKISFTICTLYLQKITTYQQCENYIIYIIFSVTVLHEIEVGKSWASQFAILTHWEAVILVVLRILCAFSRLIQIYQIDHAF